MSGFVMSALKLAALTGLGYVALCAAMFACQRSFIYFPPRIDGPADTGAMTLTVPGAELRILTERTEGRDAVLYFGGNAEDVAYSLPTMDQAFPGHALYLPRYRGYGGSTGRPSETALYADALALYDRLAPRHGRIHVVGRSLGSAVAVHLASQRPVAGLILITPFDSILEVARRQYPFLPVDRLLLDRYEAVNDAPRVSAPTRIIAAEHDEIVPRRSTEALWRSFPAGLAELRVVPGTGHNSISRSPDYMKHLLGHPLNPSAARQQ